MKLKKMYFKISVLQFFFISNQIFFHFCKFSKGWGEFKIIIVIHFRDESEPPIEVVHPLKLFSTINPKPRIDVPLVFEEYDEIVFTSPSDGFRKLIKESSPANFGKKKLFFF